MSDQLFEVAFSGVISEGANPDEVRARVGKMFNADADKLAQLFSGKRIVIKKNIDQATAAKYKTALNRAGAECEVQPTGGAAAPAPAEAANPAAATTAPAPQQFESSYEGEVPPPPQTDPLGITGDQIEDLAVSIAPVGSALKDDYQEPEEPDIDITGFDIAPVGADLGSVKKDPDPAPPDTSGLTLAD
ncbi:MAG: hypothetical protein OEN02_06010 [Gammaproteobacteria bacterium]|nr:hypothetical protein [Gammaproteobacteria bacterium]MDH3536629.1 hypothetical protein [Gammaproteobacteria bacterium]